MSNDDNKLKLKALNIKTDTTSKYYCWVVISLCALFLFYKYILQVSPSVMTDDLMREFHINGAGLGSLAAFYFYSYLVAQFFVGPLLDRFSPKYLTALAILACAFGAILFAHSHTLISAEAFRALIGIGAAFATVSYMKMSALWFRPNQMAFVDGLLATAAMTGALCSQVPLAILVSHAGWRGSLFYCGIFGIVLSSLFLFLVKDKQPAQLHLASDPTAQTIRLKDIALLFKSKKNWLLTLYSGLAFTPVAVLGGLWGNPFFKESYHLATIQSAASFTSLIFLGLALGSPVFGLLADRFHRMKIMLTGTSLAFISLSIALYCHLPLWLFGSLLFLFGFGTGSFMSCYTIGKELNHIKLAATIIAIINTGDALFGSFTEPLVGKILDLLWKGKVLDGVHYFSVTDYRIALTLLPCYLVVSIICLFWLLKLEKN